MSGCNEFFETLVFRIFSILRPSLRVEFNVFLDILKASDKVWHIALLFKLKAYGVDGELISLLENYLENRKQWVVLNGQTYEWREINSGSPQRSVLGSLLFLIYINDLPDGITSICKIFANDTSLFSKVLDINKSTKKLNLDLEKLLNGHSSGKCILILIPTNRLMKSYFLENQISILILLSLSTVMMLRNVLISLGIVLDSKLDFNIPVDNKIKN